MARKAQVRWFDRDGGGYYYRKGGKYVRLAKGPDDAPEGPTYRAAMKAFLQETALDNAEQTKDATPFAVIAEIYLQHCAENLAPATFKMRQWNLQRVLPALGNVPVGRLTPYTVDKAIRSISVSETIPDADSDPLWGSTTRGIVITAIKAAVGYAARKGIIGSNPLAGCEVPEAACRSMEVLLGSTPEESERAYQRLLSAANERVKPMLTFLRRTGCRPAEMIRASAAHFRPSDRMIVFPGGRRARKGGSHKNQRHGSDRVILLPDDALAVVKEQAALHPTGPLFRVREFSRYRSKGEVRPWGAQSIAAALTALREPCGLPNLIAYSFRHTFASDALQKGVPIIVLAQLMGTSAQQIEETYGHLAENTGFLRSVVDALFTRPVPNPDGGSPADALGSSLPRVYDPSDRASA